MKSVYYLVLNGCKTEEGIVAESDEEALDYFIVNTISVERDW